MLSLDELSKIAEALGAGDRRRQTIEEIESHLLQLCKDYSPQMVEYKQNCIWYRTVKCPDKDGFSSLHRCIYPPNGSSTYGRASRPGRKVLYAAWNLPTALDETRAEPGDYFQVIAINARPEQSILCANIGDIQRREASGRTLFDAVPEGDRIALLQRAGSSKYFRILLADAAIAEIFRTRQDSPEGHKVSAIFADSFFNSNTPILYPSVRIPNALNIAIPKHAFDTKFQVLFTQVHYVEKYIGFGIYQTTLCRETSEFLPSGDVKWSAPNTVIGAFGKYGSLEPKPGTTGWRVAPDA